jgi:hypothetical protein
MLDVVDALVAAEAATATESAGRCADANTMFC